MLNYDVLQAFKSLVIRVFIFKEFPINVVIPIEIIKAFFRRLHMSKLYNDRSMILKCFLLGKTAMGVSRITMCRTGT